VLSTWQKVAVLAKKQVTLNKFFCILSLFKNTVPVPCTDTYCQGKKRALKINMTTLYDKRLSPSSCPTFLVLAEKSNVQSTHYCSKISLLQS